MEMLCLIQTGQNGLLKSLYSKDLIKKNTRFQKLMMEGKVELVSRN